jgi:soluble lytic murein transglycosylase-like protein
MRARLERSPDTQRISLHGLGVVAGVLLIGGMVGTLGPTPAPADVAQATYTGTAVRSGWPPARGFDVASGELELARLELGRLEAIVGFSRQYQVAADLAELIYETALQQGLDPELAFRLVKMESEFKPRARSHAGAIGLTQVQLPTARFYESDITLERLYDPATNLRIGLSFLRDLIRAYDDVSLALLAYNWGPSRLRELLAQGRDPRNGYASTIMSGYQGTW